VRIAWPVFYGQYLRLTVQGRQNLPRHGAYILAANHQSHLDAGAVLTALGADSRRLHVVAARDYFFDTPWKGSFFAELLNAIPFDRHGDFAPGMQACREALEAGDPLLIFPEGTRSPDGRLQQFKAGLGVLAVELGVPVVPTRIDGTHEALPKGRRLPRPRRVTVTFGSALSPREVASGEDLLPYERYRLVAEAVREGIVELGAARHAAAVGP
jgi:long-chain acyl-CoA synthetase